MIVVVVAVIVAVGFISWVAPKLMAKFSGTHFFKRTDPGVSLQGSESHLLLNSCIKLVGK